VWTLAVSILWWNASGVLAIGRIGRPAMLVFAVFGADLLPMTSVATQSSRVPAMMLGT
jgi:hypothetical protein